MRIVSAAKYAALRAGYERISRDLEAAEKRDTERLATIQRLRTQLDRQRDTGPGTPVQHPQPAIGDVELRRQLDLTRRANRELAARLDQMQDSHIADTKELHDLRQGGAL